MPSLKGILKYTIYLFIAVWLFVLGIMVGRGNSPVSFDTRRFQARLEKIANEFGRSDAEKEKIELKFYNVLDQPVTEENIPAAVAAGEGAAPAPGKPETPETVAQKTSTKRRTFQKKMAETRSLPETGTRPGAAPEKAPVKKPPGKYTIQIAAYADFKDAVSRMAALEKKGISSYREKGKKDGVTWYRVRTGSFATHEEAKKYKETLTRKKIGGMIIKKDTP